MATSVPEEKYRFKTLEQLDRATIQAFGSYENSSCSFEKGLVLVFQPVGSLIHDTQVRDIISKYGGQLIKD